MAGGVDDGTTYTKKTAFIYIFNLVVGVGALALPSGFKQAGLFLGTIFLAFVGFIAFITTTYIIESSAASNYILKQERRKANLLINGGHDVNGSVNEGEENQGLLSQNYTDDFEIRQKTEVGQMAKLFLGDIGYKIFYGVLVIYLIGDLTIYSISVPTSLTNVFGGFGSISDEKVYYFYLFLFACFVVPFSLFNFQKTKYLQIITLITRNLAFFMMIILSIIFISQGKGAKFEDLPKFDLTQLPTMFGVSIYAFMCHHSLPSIITPIEKKSKLYTLMSFDFVLIFIAYSTICITSLFAFGSITNPTCSANNIHTFIPCSIQSLYIFNFTSYNVKFIAMFLGLFPVFTLSTNYILISITLRNNLMQLITWKKDSVRPFIRNVIFSLFSSFTPICVAFITKNVDMMVSITGSYAGLGIMFLMPVAISFFSNRKLAREYSIENSRKSKFSNNFFYILIIVISVASLVLASINLYLKNK
ncbi:transmembrane protein [Tieghemostelium lacteum]|uniref:Transmembrane protein n=1 Tax=Tieghemostelium lacteum TaxID=361077 RepID=A0A151ZDA0_TIELA|nr:transmembrane protein [Tieghemostelium lacteum]|eukprot:KYQ91920.1 transmembrane protein [Tieghemostelium lacteum]